jgi:hypothetical protein
VTPSPYRVTAQGCESPLRQCEILSHVVSVRVRPDSLGSEEPAYENLVIGLAVILTQDCDLEQDHQVRFVTPKPASDKLLPAVLMAEVYTAQDVFARIAEGNRKQWERLNIAGNKNERFHFLQPVRPGCDWLYEGLPELTIDFKRYFTVPTAELYRRIELNQVRRRCVLLSPYLEHLSSRFAYFLSRVALPLDHASE